jgi:hypothetical protein
MLKISRVFGLRPSSSILEIKKTQRLGIWICFRLQVRRESPTLLGSLERANLNHKVQKPSNSEFILPEAFNRAKS